MTLAVIGGLGVIALGLTAAGYPLPGIVVVLYALFLLAIYWP